MSYHVVAAITDRRVSEEDGAIEYTVQWEGHGTDITWERRRRLTENCAEMVQAVDQTCMDNTDAMLMAWRRSQWCDEAPTARCTKRSRSATPAPAEGEHDEEDEANEAEVLHGLLLRRPHRQAVKTGDLPSSADTEEAATVLMLGEVVLAEEASSILNGSGKPPRKKLQHQQQSDTITQCTAPAVEVEKLWREAHGHSLLHSLEMSHAVTPFRSHFTLYQPEDADTERMLVQEGLRSSHLRIVSIAPPAATQSGAVFAAPVSLEGLVGEEDVDEMRLRVVLESPPYAGAAQEIVKPHVEQMVVRYIVARPPAKSSDRGDVESSSRSSRARPSLDTLTSREAIASMPLSVFRLAFPQLLIDYLLENSVVLH